jgi:hypothetical protein
MTQSKITMYKLYFPNGVAVSEKRRSSSNSKCSQEAPLASFLGHVIYPYHLHFIWPSWNIPAHWHRINRTVLIPRYGTPKHRHKVNVGRTRISRCNPIRTALSRDLPPWPTDIERISHRLSINADVIIVSKVTGNPFKHALQFQWTNGERPRPGNLFHVSFHLCLSSHLTNSPQTGSR